MAVLLLDSDPNRRRIVIEALERFIPAFEIEAPAPIVGTAGERYGRDADREAGGRRDQYTMK